MVNGIKIKKKVKEFLPVLMVNAMKVNTLMIRKMVMVASLSPTVRNMKVIGRMENSMDLELLLHMILVT